MHYTRPQQLIGKWVRLFIFPQGDRRERDFCYRVYDHIFRDNPLLPALFRKCPRLCPFSLRRPYPRPLSQRARGERIQIRWTSIAGMGLRRIGFVLSNLLFPASLFLSRAGVSDTCHRRQKSETSALQNAFFDIRIDVPLDRSPIYRRGGTNCIESMVFWSLV